MKGKHHFGFKFFSLSLRYFLSFGEAEKKRQQKIIASLCSILKWNSVLQHNIFFLLQKKIGYISVNFPQANVFSPSNASGEVLPEHALLDFYRGQCVRFSDLQNAKIEAAFRFAFISVICDQPKVARKKTAISFKMN